MRHAAIPDTTTAAPVLDDPAMEVLERVDRSLMQLAGEFGAHQRRYPALIATETLEQAEYPEAFPHLLLTAAPLAEPGAKRDQLLAPANLAAPRWCLSPAVCLHVYAEWAQRELDSPLVITARGRCFRHEDDTVPGVRQIEFEMREIVLLGEAAWIEEVVGRVRRRLEQIARDAGLSGDWAVAEDPFFVPKAQGKAYLQRLQQTKWEYQSDDDRLALASINRHGTFFGKRFQLEDTRGEPLNTACIAVGLDRWLARCRWSTAKDEA